MSSYGDNNRQLLALPGTAGVPGFSFINATKTGMYLPAANSLALSTNATNALYINSSQQVGIGTSSPSTSLDIYNATTAAIRVQGDLATQAQLSRFSTDTSPPIFLLKKARGTTASPIAVTSGDTMGQIIFQAYGGTNNRNIAAITSSVETYTSDTDISSNLRFNTTPSGSITSQERMRIDSAGNVGIGTSSPSALLQLSNTSAKLRIGVDASSQYTDIYRDNATGYTIYNAAQAATFRGHIWQLGGTEAMRIDSSGNVGIGTSSPSTYGKLAVNGNVYAGDLISTSDGTITIGSNGAGSVAITRTGTGATSSSMTFSTTFATLQERMRIDALGNVGIGTSSPTSKLTVAGNTSIQDGAGYGWAGLTTYVGGSSASSFINFTTASTERMRIDSSGNVGIGTTSPNAKLNVYSASSTANLTQWNGGTSDANFITIAKSGTTGSTVGTPQFSLGMDYSTTYVDLCAIKFARDGGAGGNMQFFTGVNANGTERMRIDSSGNVGIGATANASAILDAQSTTKGVRFPNMTTTQKNAISSPAAGLVVFDTTLAKLCVYSGSAWQTITSV